MKKTLIIFTIIFLTTSSVNVLAQPEYGMGLIFDDEAYDEVLLKAPLTRGFYVVPARSSLKKYTPTPKSQGKYGTCTAWATAYAARTIAAAQRNGWTNKTTITNQAFSPGFIYDLIKSNTDFSCTRGSYIGDALDRMVRWGVPKYSDFKAHCPNNIPRRVYTNAASYKIKGYVKLFERTAPNNEKKERVQKSLFEGKPVIIGMKTPNSFYRLRGKFWQPTESHSIDYGGHAMTVIGYDDDKYGGAFEIQNSWGTNWGNGGYIWIKYQDFANFTKYAFELIDEPKPKPTYVPDLSGQLKFVLATGGKMQAKWVGKQYKMKRAYRSGTRFRLYISNNEPAYVYAFASDLTGQVYPIFPHKKGISPALTYKRNEVPIPDDDHYIVMDNTVGSDFICVLYSKKGLDINTIRQRVARTHGTFSEKVKKALGNQLVEAHNIKYAPSKIGFSAVSHGKTVVPLIVETKHIR